MNGKKSKEGDKNHAGNGEKCGNGSSYLTEEGNGLLFEKDCQNAYG